jgi:protein PET100, fungi type
MVGSHERTVCAMTDHLLGRFSVNDFWPKPEQTNRIPYDREERDQLLEELKARRLAARDRRLAREAAENNNNSTTTST